LSFVTHLTVAPAFFWAFTADPAPAKSVVVSGKARELLALVLVPI
jgi:hypothetical protein